MKKRDFGFEYKGKKFNIKVGVCDSFLLRGLGLMFKRKSKPLLFIFPRTTRQPIHSFFCKSFAAIWFNDKDIVDVKIVKEWKFNISPDKEFNKLLEIPLANMEFIHFTDERKV